MPTDIVIVGGGFAGIATAHELERRAQSDVRIALINRENFQLFTPMLPEVASGSLDTRAIVQPIRVGLKRTTFVLGEAEHVDFDQRTVTVCHPVLGQDLTLHFDHLVFALGAETSTMGVAGVEEHGFPLKTLPDAARIRTQICSAFEAASAARDRNARDRYLRFVIVGGGFTGVEFAGELTGYVQRLRPFYPGVSDLEPEIVMIQGGDRLLADLPDAFGTYAARSLRRRNVRIELGQEVASVDDAGLTLKDDRRIDSATIVWTAGEKPAPLIRKLGLHVSKHGALIVNPDLSVPAKPGVWGVGDCAHVPAGNGGAYAPLAQNAVREGPLLARNILAVLDGRATKSFAYKPLGMMASLGHHDAIAQLPGGRMLTGVPAWLLWRAYYLNQLPGLPEKVRVAGDWSLSGAFAQNVARLPYTSSRRTFEEDHAAEG
jgi:NADH dehydrogenase